MINAQSEEKTSEPATPEVSKGKALECHPITPITFRPCSETQLKIFSISDKSRTDSLPSERQKGT